MVKFIFKSAFVREFLKVETMVHLSPWFTVWFGWLDLMINVQKVSWLLPHRFSSGTSRRFVKKSPFSRTGKWLVGGVHCLRSPLVSLCLSSYFSLVFWTVLLKEFCFCLNSSQLCTFSQVSCFCMQQGPRWPWFLSIYNLYSCAVWRHSCLSVTDYAEWTNSPVTHSRTTWAPQFLTHTLDRTIPLFNQNNFILVFSLLLFFIAIVTIARDWKTDPFYRFITLPRHSMLVRCFGVSLLGRGSR